MKRTLLVAGAAVVLVAGALVAYGRFKPSSVAARADPAVAVAVALGALERSEGHALSADQVSAILPLLRVLRDTDPNDAEPSRALARAIMNLLTPEQRAEIERLREEARRRQQERGPGPAAPGGAPGAGPGLFASQRTAVSSDRRAELRRRVLSRLITRLEQR